jgi:hypothetical protein
LHVTTRAGCCFPPVNARTVAARLLGVAMKKALQGRAFIHPKNGS